MLEEQLPSRADRDGILFSGYPGFDNRTVREHLAELDMQNPVEAPTHSQDKVSTADPASTYCNKRRQAGAHGLLQHYLVDNHSCIVGPPAATGRPRPTATVTGGNLAPGYKLASLTIATLRRSRTAGRTAAHRFASE